MGYYDQDRFGRDRYRGGAGRQERERWQDRERGWRGDRYDRDEDRDDRGFFERAGDEVRSWFGDEEAERRRRQDDRDYERGEGRYRAGGSDRSRWDVGYDREGSGGNDWREREDNWNRERGAGGGYPEARRYRAGYGVGDGAGDYGAGRGAGATSSWGLGAGHDRDAWATDPYRSWRSRQMEELDRDYDEYQREHQHKFEQEFGTWRSRRQQQRGSLRQVQPHQEVVGSDGQHVGTVDRVQGDRILLTKSDQDAHGHHHSIPCSWIKNVGDKVEIEKTAQEAQSAWREEEERSTFLGEEGRQRDPGPHMLNRSFSGTY